MYVFSRHLIDLILNVVIRKTTTLFIPLSIISKVSVPFRQKVWNFCFIYTSFNSKECYWLIAGVTSLKME